MPALGSVVVAPVTSSPDPGTHQPAPGPAVTTDPAHPGIPPAEHDGVRDLIIIGSGPAGYTAAVYAARANLHPLVFEGSQFGGALMTTTEVENFPGFREGIQGPELMDNLRAQAERFGAELEPRDVSAVDLTATPKLVKVGSDIYRAHAVIIATGSRYRYLGLDNEQRLLGRGVSACATCDGFFFRDQDIVVVGGGDSAMEEATFLTRFANTVTVVHRRDELRASKIMQQRARDNAKIRWQLGKQVTDVLGGDVVTGVQLTDVGSGATETMPVSGMFVAIGHDPQSELFAGQLKIDDAGYIQVEHPTTRTSIDGVFACGDVVDHIYRQAITAAGTGAAAAIDAERWLAETFGER
jgi:thioredoxin reductase (NADPH)